MLIQRLSKSEQDEQVAIINWLVRGVTNLDNNSPLDNNQ